MIDSEYTADPPAAHPPEANGTHAADFTPREAEFDARIRKLEVAVAEFPPGGIEEVTDRVISRLSTIAAGPAALPPSDRVTVLDALATRAEPPAAAPPPPKGAVLHPPDPPPDPADRKWFLARFWAEVRLIARMYLDPRYRVSRTTQFALPAIALILIFNYFFFSAWVTIPFVSPVAERLLAVVLGIIGYKIMVWETARYRGVLDYLARYASK